MGQVYEAFYITNIHTYATARFLGTHDELQRVLDKGFRLATPDEANKYIKRVKRNEIFEPIVNSEGLPEVQYFCPAFKGDGYGTMAYLFQKHIKEYGIYLNREANGQKLGLCFYTPNGVQFMNNKTRIIYSMFETTKYPEFWGKHFAEADLILNPSQWGADIITKQFGLQAQELPLGYDENTYTFINRPETSEFTFLHYDAFKKRKGWDIVFNAFTNEFKDDEPVKLIFKTTLPTYPNFSEYKNITVERGVYNNAQMHELLAKANCFVFPSRGEGFGLTPLEATATGMPAIIPKHSGFMAYYDESHFYTLKKFMLEVAKYDNTDLQNMDLGYFLRPDSEELQTQMRRAYNEWKTKTGLYKDNGLGVSNYAKKFTARESAKKLAEILKRLM